MKILASAVSSISRRRASVRPQSLLFRAQSTKVDTATSSAEDGGPLGKDGRHEIWREGIYDHDNEPK